jgi:hypothetical protein
MLDPRHGSPGFGLRQALLAGFAGLCALSGGRAPAAPEDDCNANGAPDDLDVRPRFALAAAPKLSTRYRAFEILADGDGSPDVAAVHRELSGVSVPLGAGAGRFDAPGRHAVGLGPVAVVAADLDGDARQDLATADAGASTVSVLLNRSTPRASQDCNANGVPDECDVASGSRDRNADGIPDECQVVLFHRADPSGDGRIDVSDPIFVFDFLFLGGRNSTCAESADANDDGTIDISDGVFLLGSLFLGTRDPPAPGPPKQPCGRDPAAPGSARDLGCELYEKC